MKIEDVTKKKTDWGKVSAFRLSKDDYNFIKKHRINIRLLVEKAIQELKAHKKTQAH